MRLHYCTALDTHGAALLCGSKYTGLHYCMALDTDEAELLYGSRYTQGCVIVGQYRYKSLCYCLAKDTHEAVLLRDCRYMSLYYCVNIKKHSIFCIFHIQKAFTENLVFRLFWHLLPSVLHLIIHSRYMKTQHIKFQILKERLSLLYCNLIQ